MYAFPYMSFFFLVLYKKSYNTTSRMQKLHFAVTAAFALGSTSTAPLLKMLISRFIETFL